MSMETRVSLDTPPMASLSWDSSSSVVSVIVDVCVCERKFEDNWWVYNGFGGVVLMVMA